MNTRWIFIPIALVLVVSTLWYFKAHSTDSTYEAFLNRLEQDCPYYKPNGARYRECLINLVDKRSGEIATQHQQLVTDLDAITDPEYLTARQTFKQHLGELYAMWPTYRDQSCMVQADAYWGGSDQGGEFNRCRLYETEKFKHLLNNLSEEWIGT